MKYIDTLTAVIEEICTRWEIPGLTIGIVNNNEIVFTKEYGLQSLESQIPVNQESLFCMASVSKPFVATAVMQLIEQSELHLDISLSRYMPDFQMADDRYQQITLRQLLSHTSGMPDFGELEYLEMWKSPQFDEDACIHFLQSLKIRKLIFNPGEQFSYSNIAYNLLGCLITRISGLSFEEYMKSNILLPLKMRNSSFLLEEVPADVRAAPHIRGPENMVNPIYPYHRADNPSSGLHSNVEDMCHWCFACLERGQCDKNTILKPASFETMWTPIIKRGGVSIFQNMGLGWNIGNYKGAKTVSHMGGAAGFNSFVVQLPEKKSGVVLMFNSESHAVYRLLWASLDVLVGEKPAAKTVSWMIPISQALSKGGVAQARSCFLQIKNHELDDEYFIDDYSLTMLAQQLMIVDNTDYAIAVLEMSIEVYPDIVDTYICLSRAYLSKGDTARSKHYLKEALAIDPDCKQAYELLNE